MISALARACPLVPGYDIDLSLQWDTMVKEQKHVIWYTQLTRNADGSWSPGSELQNLLRGTDLEVRGVYDVEEPQKHYDIGTEGILFDASSPKPDDDVTRWNCSDLYFAHLPSFAEEAPRRPEIVTMGNKRLVGTYQDVQISPDGEIMTFLFMPYEDDANVRLYLGHIGSLDALDVFRELIGRESRLVPSGVKFAGSSDSLILTTEDCGRVTLQSLKLQSSEYPNMVYNASGVPSHYPLILRLQSFEDPVTILKNGSVAEFHPLVEGAWNKLLVSSTSFVDNSLWQVIDTRQTVEPKIVSSATRHGAKFGLKHSMVSEFWFEGADEVCVHSFVIKPSNFDPAKKYPWVLVPHGGPVGAWNDGWSARVSGLTPLR